MWIVLLHINKPLINADHDKAGKSNEVGCLLPHALIGSAFSATAFYLELRSL